MADLQAALGISQMERINDLAVMRHQYKNRYEDFLNDLPITIPFQDKDSYSALHLYPIQTNVNKTNKIKFFKS